MTEGRGMHLEGNVIYDVEKLVRNLTNAIVTFQNNLMPLPWAGPGTGNSTADPLFAYVPPLSETYFSNWADAQIMKQWLRLLPGSPGIGTGPNGRDKGGIIPMGVSLSGEPSGTTTATTATLSVGVNRRGGAIPVSDWPNGAGYTHYRWRLNTNNWSAEIPITTPIGLTGLTPGSHYVEVVGKNDAGFYQDHPDFGPNAVITRSGTWHVQAPHSAFHIASCNLADEGFQLLFPVLAGNTYSVQFNAALDGSTPWQNLTNIPSVTASGDLLITDPAPPTQTRFYRVVTPAQAP
jgi:hypothetical protein